jgi:hypothetical protein
MTDMSRSQVKAEYGRFAHLFVGGIEWLLSQWQELTGGEETDLHSHAASGGGSGVQVATVEISSAELLAMHLAGQAKVLLAGIADKIIEPLSAHFLFHPGADAYNPADNGSTLNVRWNGSAATNITPTMWAVYGLGTNAATFTRDFPGEFGVTLDGVLGAPLTIDHDQAITGGNGTLTVTVAYLVV